jgi:UMF1 family MFS transporter
VLGSVADSAGRRKPWLAVLSAFTAIGAVLLWFSYPDPSFALYALVVFCIANISFEVAQVFYNAILPTIASNEKIGRLSGWGWGVGYMGGLACLVLLLTVFIQADPPAFGLDKKHAEHVRIIGPVVGAWFAIFCLPLFLFVPDTPSRMSRCTWPRAMGSQPSSRLSARSKITAISPGFCAPGCSTWMA